MKQKSLLVIIGSAPYGGSDAAWNALRLADTALKKGDSVRIFLINAGVDAGRKELRPPENYFDLAEMLRNAVADGAEVKYCKTCIDRCGIGTGDMLDKINTGSMAILHDWIMSSDRTVTF
ncbi:MAG: DsrE family protein [Nitrospinae bacterium]|nr:DsrE family protein [Nitrospinota bacterium]